MSHAELTRKRPVQFLENPIQTTELCRFSLMCRHVCPVGHRTHQEALTPHGWALIISSAARGMIGWDTDTVDLLYKCADCGLCRAHCATDQPLPAAIAAARAEVVALGRAPQAALQVDQALRRWENPYREESPRPLSGKGETALFVGDAAHYLGSEAEAAALRLLQAGGLQPLSICVGRSSGFLASSLGFSETAARLASRNLEEILESGCKTLLVLTPGDFYALTVLYLERLNLRLPEGVQVRMVTQVLETLRQEGGLRFQSSPPGRPFAYHDACHAPRVLTDFGAPRRLLEAAWGESARPLFWRENRAHPCGAVGGLEFVQPTLASELARGRLEDAAAAGAEVLVTEDPLCRHHLQQEGGRKFSVQGLYEILAENVES